MFPKSVSHVTVFCKGRNCLAALVMLIGAVAALAFARQEFPKSWVPPTDQAIDGLELQLTQHVRPLLETLCIECHSGDRAKGDVRFDGIRTLQDAIGMPDILAEARDMLQTRLMPPKNKVQPTDEQRAVLERWLGAVASTAPESSAPIDPGWFTLHRLNRSEYRNTLRDLLGIDPKTFDVSDRLPPDDTGYGFDNNADVLTVSPLAVEQYMDSAERALEHVLGPVIHPGTPPETPLSLHVKSDGKPLPIGGGVFLAANGAARGLHAFPAPGDYSIRVVAWETHAGDENARMSVRVDGVEVASLAVSGIESEPQVFDVPVRVTAGAKQIAAAFTNDLWQPGVADRNLAIEGISVTGPIRVPTADRSKPWRAILGEEFRDGEDSAPVRAGLERFAARAYRRPIAPSEARSMAEFFDREHAQGQDWELSARLTLQAILSSPSFLCRSVENPRSDDPASTYELSGYELASRLSYFLWSSMPDDELMRLAATGELTQIPTLRAQVSRMLADRKSDAFVQNFVGQWLQLRSLDTLAIDRARFPEYTEELRADMVSEATLFFADALRSGKSVLSLLSSESTFWNDRLAGLYGVQSVQGPEFRSVKLDAASHRGGILTMAGVLTVTSNTTRTSPVKRGLFVLDQILGKPPPPPPAEIPPLEQAVGVAPDATLKQRLAAHVANPSCSACHASMDPLGLALENFDAIGRWRDRENLAVVDARGTLPSGQELRGADDLKSALLAQAEQFVRTLSAKVLTYAIGRGPEPFDRASVKRIAREVRSNDDRLDALVEAVVLSEAFRTCRGRRTTHE